MPASLGKSPGGFQEEGQPPSRTGSPGRPWPQSSCRHGGVPARPEPSPREKHLEAREIRAPASFQRVGLG